ncbi:hypothetical protein PYY25_001835 [Campylobacter coli]|nr:hypothetical protein [Campylobacter coli]
MDISLIMGPMRSGKSLELLRQAEKLHFSNKPYVLYRPKKDTRDFISRSFRPSLDLNIQYYNNEDFSESKYDYILLDEFQFFEPEIINNILESNKTFVLCALQSGTNNINEPYNVEVFRNVNRIMPFCGDIRLLTSICENCGGSCATHSYTDVITVSDDYKILCNNCLDFEIRSNMILKRLKT